MRTVAWLVLVGCGGPALGNVPHPNNAAVAGGVAAAAAAMTLADPDAAARKPEKKQDTDKRAVDVHENVPPDVFDRLDHPVARGSGDTGDAPPQTRPRKGPPPKLPSPRDAVDPGDHEQ